MNQYELYVSPTLTLTVMADNEEEAKHKCMKEFVEAREKIGEAVISMTEELDRMIK